MSDVKQTIAVIGGTGGLGSALAFRWGQAGYKIIIGSRNAEKALLSASLDLKTNIIDGKIDLYDNDIVFLTAQLKGNLENPEILIGGEVFAKDGDTEHKNIKKIFEEGVQSLINNLLSQ